MVNHISHTLKRYRDSCTVGFFLGVRDIRRSSRWSTILIIAIMVVTFLNLIVVRGKLVGLIEGANVANKKNYSGDILVTTLPENDRIKESPEVINIIKNIPQIQAYSPRYVSGATLESGYQNKIRISDENDTASASIVGIGISREDAVTGLSDAIVEGEFLKESDIDTIVIGTNLLSQYLPAPGLSAMTLDDVQVGSKIRLTVNSFTREVTVKGFVKAKSDQVDTRIFINDEQLRQMMGRTDLNVNEIALLLQPSVSDVVVKNILSANGVSDYATVQTALEGRPEFVKDIEETFDMLGNVIGTIGLSVACISIFIVIFVNAITRRKYIGILKGIGVTEHAIEFSYMIQSMFYACAGILVSFPIIFLILKPYFQQNPIDFPFSDGILVAGFYDVMVRALLLLAATVIAGYIPARIVVKQHTLDAILGR